MLTTTGLLESSPTSCKLIMCPLRGVVLGIRLGNDGNSYWNENGSCSPNNVTKVNARRNVNGELL